MNWTILLLWAGMSVAVNLTEESITKLAGEANPTLTGIEAERLGGAQQYWKARQQLETRLYGGYNHETSREKPLNPFIPIFSPVNQYQLGLAKNYQYGVSSKLQASVDTRTAPGFQSMNTTILSLELGFDLWSDFMGRITRRRLENAKFTKEQQEIQSKINKKALLQRGRKIYWALVANKEKRDLTEKLLATAKSQLSDAKRRRQSSIADTAEVARFESTETVREGTLLLLDYERENLIKALKSLFPSLLNQKINLSDYDLDKASKKVLLCTALIDSKEVAPYDYTQYDELVSILSKIQKNQEKIDVSSSIDVQLTTKIKTTGVGSELQSDDPRVYEGSFQGSLEDIEQNNRAGFEAALSFTIPLGEASDNLKTVTTLVNAKRMEAQYNDIEANIKSTHQQLSNAVKLLGKVMKSQARNQRSLNLRVKEVDRKFKQGRIPLYTLLQDREELISNNLNIIDTKLTIMNTLLDYFMVFTETPCEFNRI